METDGSILISGGTVVSSQGQFEADVLINGKKIIAIGQRISKSSAAEVISARGLMVLPGVIDAHVHFRDPGLTWKEDLNSGSRAAAVGGVTTFFDMPNTNPTTTTEQALKDKKRQAEKVSWVNYQFFIGATPSNISDIARISDVCGIKVFMGSSTGELLVHRTEDLERLFRTATHRIAVHAEDEIAIQEAKQHFPTTPTAFDHPHIRHAQAALTATQQAVMLAKKWNKHLHILHITTAEEIAFLDSARKSYAHISTEVCPHHLFWHAPDVYERHGTWAKVNPPIRDLRHRHALWDGLKTGVIDCIASDHAPHTHAEKTRSYAEAPSGVPGVETMLPLMLHHRDVEGYRLEDVVRWLCENPAERHRIANKGRILPGYDADLILVDLKKRKTVRNGELWTKVNWSLWDGWALEGWPVMTLVGGKVVFRDNAFLGDPEGKEAICWHS